MISKLNEQLENEKIIRRIFKSHEPVECIPFNENAKYIFVGRDFRDIVWSWYNHYGQMTDKAVELINQPRKYKFKPWIKYNFEDGSFTEYDMFNNTLFIKDDAGNPDGGDFTHSQLWVIGSYWNIRNLDNVKLIHFNNLKDDLPGTIRDIAKFLEIEINENNFNKIV